MNRPKIDSGVLTFRLGIMNSCRWHLGNLQVRAPLMYQANNVARKMKKTVILLDYEGEKIFQAEPEGR